MSITYFLTLDIKVDGPLKTIAERKLMLIHMMMMEIMLTVVLMMMIEMVMLVIMKNLAGSSRLSLVRKR